MANQYTTASLIEAELRASETFSTSTTPTLAQVTNWIEEESAKIEHDFGMSFASTAHTDIIDYPYAEDYIYLKNAPVISLTSVEYNNLDNQAPVWTAKTADTDFVGDLDKGRIRINPTWSPKVGDRRFRVIYTSGYASTPLIVQNLATKVVAERVLSTLLNSNLNDGNSGGSIAVGSISIVEPADFGTGSYKRLKEDIMNLKSEISQGFGVYRYSGI